MPDFWADSQHRPNYMEFLGVQPQEQQRMYGYLSRLLGTQGAQQWNRMSDILSYQNAPLATRLSAKRGIDYQTLMALEKGGFDISRYASEANREAYRWLLSMAEGEEQRKEENKYRWLSMLTQGLGNIAGGYATGYGYGKGMRG